jgi:hypothetical protein
MISAASIIWYLSLASDAGGDLRGRNARPART